MQYTRWPFPIQIQGDICNGQPVEITLHLSIDVDSRHLRHAQLAGSWFGELALLGAFAGPAVQPQECRSEVRNEGKPLYVPGRLVWNYKSLRIDPKGWVCFLNLMLESKLPISAIKISSPTGNLHGLLYPTDYPSRCKQLPFTLTEQNTPSQRLNQVVVRFHKEPSHALVAALKEMIDTWLVIGSLGGFRQEVPLGELSYIISKEHAEITGQTMHFQFLDRNVHPAAYDGLINMLVCIAQRYLAIEYVQIT